MLPLWAVGLCAVVTTVLVEVLTGRLAIGRLRGVRRAGSTAASCLISAAGPGGSWPGAGRAGARSWIQSFGSACGMPWPGGRGGDGLKIGLE